MTLSSIRFVSLFRPSRTIDMIGNVVLLNATMFQPAKQDRGDRIIDPLLANDPPGPDNPPANDGDGSTAHGQQEEKKSAPTDSADPVKSSEPVKQSEPTGPNEIPVPAKLTESGVLPKPPRPPKSAKVVQSTKPTDPTETIELAELTDLKKLAECSELIELSELTELDEPSDETTKIYIAPAPAVASTSASTSTPVGTKRKSKTDVSPKTASTSPKLLLSDSEGVMSEEEKMCFSEVFLSSCAELAQFSFGSSNDEGATWFARFCRRCSNVRGWFPTMCSCMENSGYFDQSMTGNYHRLGVRSNIAEFNIMMEEIAQLHAANEEDENETEDLIFYTDDGQPCHLQVHKNLRTIDLCKLLRVKRNVSGIEWSIVETWPTLGIERTLEDHEDIHAVHKEMKLFASQHERKFHFRTDFLKYEFFFSPQQFFPPEMVPFPAAFGEDQGTLMDAETALRHFLDRDDGEPPQVFSLVWLRISHLNLWRRTHMLLRNRKLYLARKSSVVALDRLPSNDKLILLATLSDYVLYKITNARKRYNGPFEWGICLRPSYTATTTSRVGGESGLKIIAFRSEKARLCWLTAMRLAKYGKQLRENYKAFKNKQCEQGGDGSKERYNIGTSTDTVRSHVAMDFTGKVGRIVEDPKEVKQIVETEGANWRRNWKPFSRTPLGRSGHKLHGLDESVHIFQPWFHRGLRREVAAAIIKDNGSVDGVYLVRDSKSNLGAYVLTYKFSDRVYHTPIQPMFDQRCNCWLFSLDKGITKFFSLQQLIDFYKLNAGGLPTRLTHYVQNSVLLTVPKPEVGVGTPSPSPPGSAHRLSGVATDSSTEPTTPTGHGRKNI